MAAGKKSCCKILLDWAQSASNHVYWCAANSQGNQELVKTKWLSVLNHVCDVHEGHGDLFPACEHASLELASHEPRLRNKKGNLNRHICTVILIVSNHMHLWV